MKAAQLFVRCLENEGVKYIYGIPGEENLDIMDALLTSTIRFVTTRHEQGAAFMADVQGRLTGRAGVCLSTLGPGATNLVTGVADANMDHAPLVAIAGQAATNRLHKESHQVLDLVNLFLPITKYASQILNPEIIPEVVRKAFKVAQSEKPGASFIEFPENLAPIDIEGEPLLAQAPASPYPPTYKLEQAAQIISEAQFPLILAGNGIVRAGQCDALLECAEKLNIPVATTFMAKGAIPSSHPLSLGTVGLQARDYVSCGFDRADVIICVGYDLVEYHPNLWHKTRDRKIIHIDSRPAEVDSHYIVATGVVGDFKIALKELAGLAKPHHDSSTHTNLRAAIFRALHTADSDPGFPLKPQRIIADLRKALDADDIVICDVGAHKMWMARMFPCEKPNTCIISNGFASMGIAVPGAVSAKLSLPDRKVVAVTGDAGFLMNSQEIETALRMNAPFVILIWNDGSYGLIEWKQHVHFGRESNVKFNNPDFVKYAESFGAKGYRIQSVDELLPTLQEALTLDRVAVIDCPVDYRENMKLTAHLGEMVCPI
jgi:acetolactate synthase-1/2/3 large subunit